MADNEPEPGTVPPTTTGVKPEAAPKKKPPEDDDLSSAKFSGFIHQVAKMLEDTPLGQIFKFIDALLGGGRDDANDQPVVPVHATDLADKAVLAERQDRITGGAVTILSMIDFNKPVPKSEIGQNDRKLVAEELFALADTVSFSDGKGGFKPLAAATPEALTEMIKNNPTGLARIDAHVGDQHNVSFVQQFVQVDREDSGKGFTGAGFWVTNDKGEKQLTAGGKPRVWAGAAGYTGDESKLMDMTTDGTPQSKTLEGISKGELTAHAAEAVNLASIIAEKAGAGAEAKLATHSMATASGNIMDLVFKGKGLSSENYTNDPGADSAEVKAIQNSAELRTTLGAIGVPESKLAELEQFRDAHPLRVVFKGADDQVQATLEGSMKIGDGLQGGIRHLIANGNLEGNRILADQNLGNDLVGDRREYLDVSVLHLSSPVTDGHKLVNIIKALENKDATLFVQDVREAGKALAGSTVTEHTGTPTQPAGATAKVIAQDAGRHQ